MLQLTWLLNIKYNEKKVSTPSIAVTTFAFILSHAYAAAEKFLMYGGDRRRRNYSGVFFLLLQLYSIGIEYIPPLTLFLTSCQIISFLDLFNLALPTSKACLSVQKIWLERDYLRFYLAPFTHANDNHLYYNMLSFVWKGIDLENAFGSVRFAACLSILFHLTGFIQLAMLHTMFFITSDIHYLTECSVGFSGVIFALKVVSAMRSELATMNLVGIFAECAMLSFLISGVSFYGHLAGILAGYLYSNHYFVPLENLLIEIYEPIHKCLVSLSGYAEGEDEDEYR